MPPLQEFILNDREAQRGEGATRRQIANSALIRHRQKATPTHVMHMAYADWAQYVAWQLEWENAILRYRDGNNDEAERTLNDRRRDTYRNHT